MAEDGVLQDWEAWSACSLTCGTGWRTRHRKCAGPFYGGLPCADYLNETETCYLTPCPGELNLILLFSPIRVVTGEKVLRQVCWSWSLQLMVRGAYGGTGHLARPLVVGAQACEHATAWSQWTAVHSARAILQKRGSAAISHAQVTQNPVPCNLPAFFKMLLVRM